MGEIYSLKKKINAVVAATAEFTAAARQSPPAESYNNDNNHFKKRILPNVAGYHQNKSLFFFWSHL